MGQQDLKVYELVAKMERSEIRLPEMQRHYVWQQTRVRDLLDSLYRGYPSGTILTWETDEDVATRDAAVDQDVSTQQRFQLLLDGQQRLTSLSAIVSGKPVDVRGRKRPIDILFNLEHPEKLEEITEVFEDEEAEDDTDADPDESTTDASEDEILKRFNRMAFVVHSSKLARLPNWVSVTHVFKETSDKSFLASAGVTSMDDERYDKYTSRLKKLRDIKNYSYRVHILDQNKSYEEVTEIFVRVNSLGAKLRSSDLALAQITAKWRGSLEIFQKFEEECQEIGFDLGLAIHLKNLVAFATGQSRFKIVGNLQKERLEASWNDAKKGMNFALNFLRSNAGIDSPALLSSPFIVITLAAYGHKKKYKLTPTESDQLRYWVIVSNAKARYSRGSSETFLDQDLATLRRDNNIYGLLKSLKTQVGRLNVLPEDLENKSSRSAYFKTMFMAFKEDGARDWQDQLVISLNHSSTQHKLQFHHIFPKAVLEKKKSDLPSQKINDICNLVFISGSTNRRISNKEPSIYLPDFIDKIGVGELQKQCVPSDQSLWKVDDYESFLTKRRELIAEKLNKFIGHDQWGLVEPN
jgi:hypothetical protein